MYLPLCTVESQRYMETIARRRQRENFGIIDLVILFVAVMAATVRLGRFRLPCAFVLAAAEQLALINATP